MTKPFDVNRYWLERGRTYIDETRTPAEYHRLQERFLLDVLRRGRIPMQRVLELGCGFGRITRLLATEWPEAAITALDLSPEQLAQARHYCSAHPSVQFEQYDFYSGAPLPGSDYDVVLAIEVFLHHPPEVVGDWLRKLSTIGRHVVNIDWSEPWRWPTPAHVWVHDYAKLYGEAGLQCAVFPLPMKVDGKQQKLFVAAKRLSPEFISLETEWRASAESPDPSGVPSPGEWSCRWEQAVAELAGIIPRGSPFILVDDEQGGGLTDLNGCRVIPFLEKEGRYWGPPDTDATAWRELARLRKLGATAIAFAWPSFWWLEHYTEFHRQLRAQFRCLLENERLVVFALTP
jgi:SAM-dependent methyltransferase